MSGCQGFGLLGPDRLESTFETGGTICTSSPVIDDDTLYAVSA